MGHREWESREAEGPPELQPDSTNNHLTTATNGIAPQHNGCPTVSGSADWQPVPGLPGYECRPPDDVRSVGRIVETSTGPRRYSGASLRAAAGRVSPSVCGRRRTLLATRVVASTFHGTPCVVCAEVVSTMPPPWVCARCSWSPPRPDVEPLDLDAIGVTS